MKHILKMQTVVVTFELLILWCTVSMIWTRLTTNMYNYSVAFEHNIYTKLYALELKLVEQETAIILFRDTTISLE
jgi:hypothetical protein